MQLYRTVKIIEATRLEWKKRRLLWLGGAMSAVAWLMIGQVEVLGCGGWKSFVNTSATMATSGNFNEVSMYTCDGYSTLVGGDAVTVSSYAGCSAGIGLYWFFYPSAGPATGTGWSDVNEPGWTYVGPPHHGAPNDGHITGQGDSTVCASLHLCADNGDGILSNGTAQGHAFAKTQFSGLASATVQAQVDFTLAGSTLLGSASLTANGVQINLASNGWSQNNTADPWATDSTSVVGQFTGNLTGQRQHAFGTGTVSSSCKKSAFSSTASASTSNSKGMTIDFGGNGGPCSDGSGYTPCPTRHTH